MRKGHLSTAFARQLVVVISIAAALLGIPTLGFAAPILGSTLASFAVLGASSVTNTGPTTLVGNLGVSNNSAPNGITGFFNTLANDGPGVFVGSDVMAHQGDAFAGLADNQLVTAINTLNGMGPGITLGNGDLTLAGTLTPNVYTVPFAISNLTGSLTLDGLGNPNALWVFLFPASSLITSPNSSVNVINVGLGNNIGIFWNVGSTASLDTNTVFAGNILASAAITMNNGVVITCGRALAHTAEVTLINDHISAGCSGGTDVPTTPAVPEPTTLILVASGLVGAVTWKKRQID